MKEPIRKLQSRGAPAPANIIRYVVAGLILRERLSQAGAASRESGERQPESAEGVSAAREILICQRRADQPMSLKWEFPGGKIEAGETPEGALQRELNEELGIDAQIGRRVASLRHRYRNGASIDLQFFLVPEFVGELENRIFNAMRWSPLGDLPGYDFLAADVGLVRELADGKLI